MRCELYTTEYYIIYILTQGYYFTRIVATKSKNTIPDCQRMHWSALLTCILTVSLINQVSGLEIVNGKYGETVEIPCKNGRDKAKDVTVAKWKYGNDIKILVKKAGQNANISEDVIYKDRVSIKEDFSLIIKQVTLGDQKTFTCIVVTSGDILENNVQLVIYKAPSQPQIAQQASVMETGKLTTLAQCRTSGANPAANITWFKNKTPLVPDEMGIVINTVVDVDSRTGLSTTTSKLVYAAVKEDIDAQFTCRVEHIRSAEMESAAIHFNVIYPTETVSLQVMSHGPFKEGDNVTLKCIADGNPPPKSYNFYIKDEKKTVENSNTYNLTHLTRANTGEYKCSLVDNEEMASFAFITVDYLDVVLSTTGKITKKLGESFEITLNVNASGKHQVSWRKGNSKLDSFLHKFDKLKYSDAGVYECVVSMAGLQKTHTFELIVESPPVIKSLIKKRGDESMNKVLSCEAEGSPKPTVHWSVNGTNVAETAYVDGKIMYSITIVVKVNLTVSCTVSNVLGSDIKNINVSAFVDDVTMDKREDQKDDYSDQAALAVGIVVGLILATLAIGLAYWLYLKKFRQGSWKTGEKEDGSAEESKKLEENKSQKADV
ncbi:CD166 antigen homolog A-like isoform X2 [Xyrauchen texanus]|uniref:CD166 antigen homolog A-like isoform X2 n=1 Tax=Xyrauchen texanus TaxID=154827 RepID=UPI002241D032|nr:CD166 antigen homolog A-like isoform X2 [Xyrauchen texanus]